MSEPLWSDRRIYDEAVLRVREQKHWAGAIKVATTIRDDYEEQLAKPAIPPNVREAIRKIADYGMPLGANNYDWRGWRDTALTWLDAQEDRP